MAAHRGKTKSSEEDRQKPPHSQFSSAELAVIAKAVGWSGGLGSQIQREE